MMPVGQIWVICVGAAAIRLGDGTRSLNAEWTGKGARRGGNCGSWAYSVVPRRP